MMHASTVCAYEGIQCPNLVYDHVIGFLRGYIHASPAKTLHIRQSRMCSNRNLMFHCRFHR
ncbi:hypothetical protein D3C76_1419930 [compost metagenome]